MDARELPSANVLKLDTEGSEIIILRRLQHCGRLNHFAAISVEYHHERYRREIDMLLQAYEMTSATCPHHHRGVLNYVRGDILV